MNQDDKAPASTQFTHTPLASIITGHAVVVAAFNGDVMLAKGSGVFIAPGLVATAKHVVDGYWRDITDRPMPRSGTAAPAPFGMWILQFPGDSASPVLWVGERVWRCNATDAALVQAVIADQPVSAPERSKLAINPLGPQAGESVFGFGYPSSSAKVKSLDPLSVDWTLQGHTTVGEVTCLFPEGRDRAMLPFPCFETDARFDGGMSGGPIFDSRGRLCGLVCASLDTDSQGPYTSYGAILWPAFLQTIEFRAPGLDVKRPYGAWELSKVGYIQLDGWPEIIKRVWMQDDPDTGHRVPRLRNSP